MKNLLYTIKAKTPKEEIIGMLKEHPEIKFVSLVGIDLAGNDTDEKIPVRLFIKDIDEFYAGTAVQTDGSSVVLPGIATLNNAKVDMPVDPNVNWFVDYNFEYFDDETNKPVGTLRIPSFLIHEGKRVDSRAVLTDTLSFVKRELLDIFHEHAEIEGLDVSGNDITDIVFTSATELEFWVKTPLEEAAIKEMSASQVLQEQYWERTHGAVRCALEKCLVALDEYGLQVEMGHKEVGGLKAQIDESGRLTHVCEQLEIDWKFADAVQAADNEIVVRTIVKEIFRAEGLEVSFKAKPMIGLAGNGEHTHIGLAAVTSDGKVHNLFAAKNPYEDFMSVVGYGSIMGLLKNYEVINPFVSATNDSLNRLKPGFEAPVCIVTSLGHTPKIPSRNRTILAGLIRDLKNPMATRFELRACNPYTNTYLVLAAAYSAILDGIRHTIDRSAVDLLTELSKKAGQDGFYLEKSRAYRSEQDVFEDYTAEERNNLFGTPPATVWENMEAFEKYPAKVKVITAGGALRPQIIKSFKEGALLRWKTELIARILPEMRDIVRAAQLIENNFRTDQDSYNWNKLKDVREYLAKDSIDKKSLFTRLTNALTGGDFATASKLQVEMYDKIEELKKLHDEYVKNNI
ncbi:MAG: glutamine synthetase [Selenomonadaceae bacterium]|nr:glutamine synthetase [Selenomonadaceae bacterium]MBR7025935.1 glutamine synthetase [Selenomonadaceae bacterium]